MCFCLILYDYLCNTICCSVNHNLSYRLVIISDCNFHGQSSVPEAFLAIMPGRPWPTQTRAWPIQTVRAIPMIPTYTTPVVLTQICLAFDWPTQMKIPRTASISVSQISMAVVG